MQCGVTLGTRQAGQAPNLGMEAAEIAAVALKQALKVRHQAIVGGLQGQGGIVDAVEPSVEAAKATEAGQGPWPAVFKAR